MHPHNREEENIWIMDSAGKSSNLLKFEKMLSSRSGRCLSYRGRFQLVNWTMAEKFSYWAQGTTL